MTTKTVIVIDHESFEADFVHRLNNLEKELTTAGCTVKLSFGWNDQRYNPLDNIEAAKKLREQLILENQDIGSSLQYDYATSWCDDCPQREREPESYSEQEFGIYYAPSCCKEDGNWEENNASSLKKQRDIDALIKALSAYLDEVSP